MLNPNRLFMIHYYTVSIRYDVYTRSYHIFSEPCLSRPIPNLLSIQTIWGHHSALLKPWILPWFLSPHSVCFCSSTKHKTSKFHRSGQRLATEVCLQWWTITAGLLKVDNCWWHQLQQPSLVFTDEFWRPLNLKYILVWTALCSVLGLASEVPDSIPHTVYAPFPGGACVQPLIRPSHRTAERYTKVLLLIHFNRYYGGFWYSGPYRWGDFSV